MNWKKVKLGECVKISKGKKHEETPFSEFTKRYIQIEDLSNINNLKFTNEVGVEVQTNDVIIAWDGANAGKVGTNLVGYIGSTLARLRILSDELNHKYFFRFLDSNFDKIKSQRTGATIPHVSGDALRNLEILLPDLATQKHIAEVLDKADALRQQNRQLLAHYGELLQSTFIELFGDPVKNQKGWEVKKLGEVVEKFKYGTNEKSGIKNSELSTAIIRIPNVLNNKVNFNDLKFAELSEKEMVDVKLQRGDLLFVRSNGNPAYIGRCAVFDSHETCGYASYLIRARLKSNTTILPQMIQFIISYETYRPIVLKKATTTAGNYNINTDSLKNLEIPVPPLPLQQHFAKIVEQIEAQKTEAQAALAESEALFEGLLAGYFNA